MSSRFFRYLSHTEVDPRLKCGICLEPFIDPVIVDGSKRYCRSCIISDYQSRTASGDDSSATLINRLIPVNEPLLFELLDSIVVQCTLCEKTEIRRGAFEYHIQNECPKRNVQCSATDLNCPWTGRAEARGAHVLTCSYERLRPALKPALSYPKELDEVKKKLEATEKERVTLGKMFQAVIEVSQRQALRINALETQLAELANAQARLQQNYDEVVTRLPLQSAAVVDPKPEEKPTKDDHRRLEEAYQRLREICDKHEIQINLISKKKHYLSYRNDPEQRLSKFLQNLPSTRQLTINRQRVTHDDMHYICENQLRKNRCHTFRLENSEVSAESIEMLAESLMQNTTLTELTLINDGLSDLSIHPLALTLATTNKTLTSLELRENHLTDISVQYLADTLKVNQTITFLGLAQNQITNYGVRLLAEALGNHNRTLEVLSIASNRSITDVVIDDLIAMLRQGSLLILLSMDDCHISTEGKARFLKFSEQAPRFTVTI